MTVHLFGAVSSPSCACYALRRTADDYQSSFPDEVIGTMHRNFYVDDCLKKLSMWRKQWNFRLDCKERAHTRRGILSVGSLVYDLW